LRRPDLEALARTVWARILSVQHQREAALAQYEQVVALAKITQDQFAEADGWIGIGAQFIWQADVSLAREPLHHALNLCQDMSYKPGELETLILLGELAVRQEALDESIDYDKQALQLSRLLGDVAAEAEVLGSMAVGVKLQGDLADSLTYDEEALAIFRRLNMPESEAWILGELGDTATRLGDYANAERRLSAALTIARELKDEFWQAWVNLHLGIVWSERGETEKGLSLIAEAFQTADQLQNLRFKAAVLYYWGLVLFGQSDWISAEQRFQEAYDLRRSAGQTELALPALAGLAYVACQQEKLEKAAAHAEQLWQTWQASPSMAERADLKLYWLLGKVWDGLGDSRTTDLWKKAHALLLERSGKIPDERLRKTFLEQVPAHRAILGVQA
jgi:tetratricopeptide (TPR) repeat protein